MWRLPYYLILAYRRWLSPLLPATCRFYPTCSAYGAEALRLHGLGKGSWLLLKRLARCHPWHPGGVDHVPVSPGHDQAHAHDVSRGGGEPVGMNRTGTASIDIPQATESSSHGEIAHG